MTMKRKLFVLGVCLFCCWKLLSCGLDNIPFIIHVPEPSTSINGTLPAGGFRLPSESDDGYNFFQSFIIFYRIYLSDLFEAADSITESAQRIAINPVMNTDFNVIMPWTEYNSTSVPTNLDTSFFGRRFMKLELEDADIDVVLGRTSLGGTLGIVFPHAAGNRPHLLLNGSRTYYLRRAVGSPTLGGFDPEPEDDLGFLNHPDLRARANVSANINADVVDKAATAEEQIQYSYVMMYIAAVGRNYHITPPPRFFSQPTFLGVFRLPNP